MLILFVDDGLFDSDDELEIPGGDIIAGEEVDEDDEEDEEDDEDDDDEDREAGPWDSYALLKLINLFFY